MEKTRILHISQAVGGGVERYIQMMLKYTDTSKYENIVVISDEAEPNNYLASADHVIQVEMHRSIGLWDLKSVIALRRIIQEFEPDILYAHSSKAGAVARIANMGMNKICIYNPHGWAFNMLERKQWLYLAIEKRLAPFCDKIICISNTEKKSALAKRVCAENKLSVILNGIDVPAYGQPLQQRIDRDALNIPREAFVVGMVGRISWQKAPDVFIRAAELIKKRIPSAYFIMVGNGEMEKEICQFVAEHGFADSLVITGWVNEPMQYIQQFDAALLLSRWEGFGLAIAEYMLAQKPIVASRVDAIPELVQHEENGLLVNPEDPEAAADAVCRIYSDVFLREKLTKNSYRLAQEKYNICRVVKEHEQLFAQCMNSKKKEKQKRRIFG